MASVALALAIPLKTDDGGPFPDRDEIVFIAFGVIMATLVLQGLTLPWLVRRLGVRADTDAGEGVREGTGGAGGQGGEAAAAGDRGGGGPAGGAVRADAAAGLRHRGCGSARTWARTSGARAHEQRVRRLKRVRRIQGEMLSAARHEVLAARSEPGADPEIVDRVLRHLDVRSLR